MHILVLTKRQYTNRDVIDDRYGRLWEIPKGLAARNCRVTCLCLSYKTKGSSTESYEDVQGHTVTWKSVDLGFFKITGFLKYLYLVYRTIRNERPDVIWSCSDTIYAVIGFVFSRIHKCISFVDLYDNFEYFGSYRIPGLRALYRKAVRESGGVSCVSESLRRHIVNAYGRAANTTLVTNAVDANVFRPMDKAECRERLGLPQDATLIGSAGDISNYRGADMLYRLILAEPGLPGGVSLAVAGFRDDETTVPSRDNVHDLGMLPVEQVPVFLNSLDIAVVYNRSSTFGDYCFPQKFYEILACGIPMVAANVGELRLLLDEYEVLLYEDGDIESMRLAIERQMQSRALPALRVPGWDDQAELLLTEMNTLVAGA